VCAVTTPPSSVFLVAPDKKYEVKGTIYVTPQNIAGPVAAVKYQPDASHRDVKAKDCPKDTARGAGLYQITREIQDKATKQ
jgi:hypothetical protein